MVEVNKIIEGAIQDLIDDCSLSKVLLKAQTVASLLDSKELKEWVRQEEFGWKYDSIPSYRQVRCVIKVCIINGNQLITEFSLPNACLPKELWDLYVVKINNSISEIESWADRIEPLKIPIPVFHFHDINACVNGQVQGAWQEVSNSAVKAIISKVKSSLLDYFLELNKTMGMNVNLQDALTKERFSKIAMTRWLN